MRMIAKIIASAICMFGLQESFAQAPPSNRIPTGTYETPKGAGTVKDPKNLPDFNGVWERNEGLAHPDQTKIIPFMKPEAAKDWQAKIAAHDFRVPWSFCEPTAFPAMLTEFGLGFEILMTPERVTVIAPDGQVRRIYTDGSAHAPPSPAGTYFGDSIGHWEDTKQGKTLVIETTDLRPDNNLVMGLQAGNDQLKVIERMRLLNADRIEDQITMTGPDYLKEPYKYTQVFKRVPKVRVGEFVCLPSKNRNTGESVDLTPPPL